MSRKVAMTPRSAVGAGPNRGVPGYEPASVDVERRGVGDRGGGRVRRGDGAVGVAASNGLAAWADLRLGDGAPCPKRAYVLAAHHVCFALPGNAVCLEAGR